MNSKSKQEIGFYNLDINDVLNAVDRFGLRPTGEYFQLNSYENRVFDIFLEEGSELTRGLPRVIAKVYRPNRWSLDQILEEHQFLFDLSEGGVPAVAPILSLEGGSVVNHRGMMTSCFPRAMGRMPQELSAADLTSVGRQLAQLHNIGARQEAKFRRSLNVDDFGWAALERLETWIAPEVHGRYMKAAETLLDFLHDGLCEFGEIRIHGDCHRGNILQTDPLEGGVKELFFVDFDDFVSGPEVQDFWMLLSGGEQDEADLQALLKGYEEFRDFDHQQLGIIPGLRGLRIIHYAGWIAQRWSDPSFPKLFPEFKNYIYWAEEVEQLERLAWAL